MSQPATRLSSPKKERSCGGSNGGSGACRSYQVAWGLFVLLLLTAAGLTHAGLPTITESDRRTSGSADYRLGADLAVNGDHCAAQGLSGFIFMYRASTGWASDSNLILSSGTIRVVDMDANQVAYAYDGAGRAPLSYSPVILSWGNGNSPDTTPAGYLPGNGSDAEAIAIHEGLVAIGRPELTDPGLVDLYVDDPTLGWQHEQSLTQGSSAGLRFGAALDVDYLLGEMIVGMPRSSPSDYGLVYHYKLNNQTWTFHDFFAAPNSPAGDQFGSAIAFSNPYLAVGAPKTTNGGSTQEGAVFIYKLVSGTFEYQTTLYGGGGDYDHFGSSLALNAHYLVAGSPDEDLDVPPFPVANVGAAYLWKWNSGTLEPLARLQASDGAALDFFGSSVAVTTKGAVVGAPFADTTAGVDAGVVYFFEPMFSDGFESGDIWEWSETQP